MLEKILNFSLTQRFLIIMGAVLLVGVGIISWNSLTLDAVPDITTNQVVVNTETPGMGPAEVEKLVDWRTSNAPTSKSLFKSDPTSTIKVSAPAPE